MSDGFKLITGDSHHLHEPAPTFDFANPPCDPVELANGLIDTMLKENGLGLSACQVGLNHRVFVMHTSPTLVCFNPRIVDQTSEEILLDEACLSFPELVVKIKRPRFIKARFTDAHGHTHTMKFDGMTARCFMHELDHLNGVVFYTRANTIHREAGFKKMKELQRMKKRFNNSKMLQTLAQARISHERSEQNGKEEVQG